MRVRFAIAALLAAVVCSTAGASSTVSKLTVVQGTRTVYQQEMDVAWGAGLVTINGQYRILSQTDNQIVIAAQWGHANVEVRTVGPGPIPVRRPRVNR